MTRILIAAIALTLLACGTSSNDGDNPGSIERITAKVREVDPHATTTDIAADIDFMRTQAPDATDEQIADWIIEAVEWNNCLEEHDGYNQGCTEVSPDNPRGW